MAALTGRYEHSLDPKNRLFVPSRYRDQLNAEGGKHFMLAQGLDKCLSLFLPSQWDTFLNDLSAQKFRSPQERRATLRHFFSTAAEAPLDEQGRILVPQPLKDFAKLKKDVVIVGAGKRAELWDSKTFEAVGKAAQEHFGKISASLDL